MYRQPYIPPQAPTRHNHSFWSLPFEFFWLSEGRREEEEEEGRILEAKDEEEWIDHISSLVERSIMLEDNSKKMKVKKGFLAVQVGLEDEDGGVQRFVIPISYLYHPLFRKLLDKAQEAYGYHTKGPLRLPCSVDDFLHLRWRIEREPDHHNHHSHPHLSSSLSFHPCWRWWQLLSVCRPLSVSESWGPVLAFTSIFAPFFLLLLLLFTNIKKERR